MSTHGQHSEDQKALPHSSTPSHALVAGQLQSASQPPQSVSGRLRLEDVLQRPAIRTQKQPPTQKQPSTQKQPTVNNNLYQNSASNAEPTSPPRPPFRSPSPPRRNNPPGCCGCICLVVLITLLAVIVGLGFCFVGYSKDLRIQIVRWKLPDPPLPSLLASDMYGDQKEAIRTDANTISKSVNECIRLHAEQGLLLNNLSSKINMSQAFDTIWESHNSMDFVYRHLNSPHVALGEIQLDWQRLKERSGKLVKECRDEIDAEYFWRYCNLHFLPFLMHTHSECLAFERNIEIVYETSRRLLEVYSYLDVAGDRASNLIYATEITHHEKLMRLTEVDWYSLQEYLHDNSFVFEEQLFDEIRERSKNQKMLVSAAKTSLVRFLDRLDFLFWYSRVQLRWYDCDAYTSNKTDMDDRINKFTRASWRKQQDDGKEPNEIPAVWRQQVEHIRAVPLMIGLAAKAQLGDLDM